jgi:hypothetical protein
MVLVAVGREIVVYPELLQVMQEGGLFRGIEATESDLYWADILREEFGGTSSASLQLPPNDHDASFDSIEARLQPVAYRSFFSPEEIRRYCALRRRRKVSADNRTDLPAKARAVQFAKASRPPGFKTRAISEATVAWSGENMIPNIETSTSKHLGAITLVVPQLKEWRSRTRSLLESWRGAYVRIPPNEAWLDGRDGFLSQLPWLSSESPISEGSSLGGPLGGNRYTFLETVPASFEAGPTGVRFSVERRVFCP